MTILYLLVPLALLLAGLGVWAFAWAVRKGQFDDVHTPAMRMLVDEEEESEVRRPTHHQTNTRSRDQCPVANDPSSL